MKGLSVIAILAAATASPALAGERWLVYTGGEKPNRIFVVVDETYLDAVPRAEKTYKLETVTILENAKSPDWVSSNMIIDCARQTLEETLIQVSPRGGKLTTAPDQPAHPPKNAVGHALIGFACDMGPKDAKKRLAARKADNRKRGWMFMGPLSTGEIGDVVWNTVWTDGTRPGSTPRSDAELAREMEALGKRRQQATADARTLASQTAETSKAQAERFEKAREPIARIDARRKREPQAVRRTFDPWLNQPEAEVIRVWGQPNQSQDLGDKRILSYQKEVVVRIEADTQGCPKGQRPQQVTSNMPPVCMPAANMEDTYRTYRCTVGFEIREGLVADYVTRGAKDNLDPFPHCTHVFGQVR